MNRFQLASLLLLCCGLASVRAQAACMLNDKREDCGEWPAALPDSPSAESAVNNVCSY